MIAGKAEPLSEVQVTFGAAPLETVRADQNGSFVALVQLPAWEVPQTMGLTQLQEGDSAALTSAQTVLVVPPQLDAVECHADHCSGGCTMCASVLQASQPANPARQSDSLGHSTCEPKPERCRKPSFNALRRFLMIRGARWFWQGAAGAIHSCGSM